jgi:CxC2 like cysteine cluster associated with KDZ transposases
MGLHIQLGHTTGPCVNPKSGHQDFVVLHVNGIHLVAVDFCDCEHSMPHRIQLLRADLFPATVHQPQTCCTNRLLEQFHLLTLASKVSGYEFYKSLERMSDNTGLLPIKVGCHRHEFDPNLTIH